MVAKADCWFRVNLIQPNNSIAVVDRYGCENCDMKPLVDHAIETAPAEDGSRKFASRVGGESLDWA